MRDDLRVLLTLEGMSLSSKYRGSLAEGDDGITIIIVIISISCTLLCFVHCFVHATYDMLPLGMLHLIILSFGKSDKLQSTLG